MKREEALCELNKIPETYSVNNGEIHWGKVVINKIYDVQELKTCDNCRDYTDGFGVCNIACNVFDYNDDLNKSNFSCNKWEKK